MLVYRIHFSSTDKCYVGKTIKKLDERKSQHIRFALNYNSQFPVHRAIRKHGNPIFEVLFETDDYAVLTVKEKEFIKLFDSFRSGYNATEGGEGTISSPRPKSIAWCASHSFKMTGVGNPRYGYKFTTNERAEHSNRMSDYYKINPGAKAWGNKSALGLRWINDGKCERKIPKEDNLPETFVYGRMRRDNV